MNTSVKMHGWPRFGGCCSAYLKSRWAELGKEDFPAEREMAVGPGSGSLQGHLMIEGSIPGCRGPRGLLSGYHSYFSCCGHAGPRGGLGILFAFETDSYSVVQAGL